MTIHELSRRIRRLAFHLRKRSRAKMGKELMEKLSGSFKHEPHPVFKGQPN